MSFYVIDTLFLFTQSLDEFHIYSIRNIKVFLFEILQLAAHAICLYKEPNYLI